MIDTTLEKPITLTQAAAELPCRRAGRKTHVSTLYRWALAGCRGVVLETIQVGGTLCTTREALQRFFERLSAQRSGVITSDRGSGPLTGFRSAAQRRRDSEAAGRRLADMGA